MKRIDNGDFYFGIAYFTFAQHDVKLSGEDNKICTVRPRINRIALETASPRAHVRVFALLRDSSRSRRRPRCSMHFSNERRNAARILDQHRDAWGLTFLSIPRLTLMRRLWRRISMSILYARTDNSLGERVNCADLCSPIRRRIVSAVTGPINRYSIEMSCVSRCRLKGERDFRTLSYFLR